MNSTRKKGVLILLCGLGMFFIFNNEVVGIVAAVIIGLGIGVALTGRYGSK